jgi:hypothetical protein
MSRHSLALLSLLTGCYLGSQTYAVDPPETPPRPDGGLDAGEVDSGNMTWLDGSLCCKGDFCFADSAACLEPVVDAHEPACSSAANCTAESPVCGDAGCTVCTSNTDCDYFASSGHAVCGSNGSCVQCMTDHHDACVDATTVCEPASSTCVECTADSQAACEASDKVCKDGGHVCVECNTSAECLDAAKPFCGEDNKCRPCTADAECSGGTICDTTSGAFKGQCVGCTPAREAEVIPPSTKALCDGKSCNPFTRECTSRTLGQTQICRACSADSECTDGHRCIQMNFGEQSHRPLSDDEGGGGYCLKIVSGANCDKPYTFTLARTSISGVASGSYCGLDEGLTTCEAVRRYGDDCPTGDASVCASAGARCEIVGSAANICTYSCSDATQCLSNKRCDKGSTGSSYCGAP